MIIQPILKGLESSFGLNGQEEIILSKPREVVEFYEDKGYEFLADWNSGKFLVRNSSDEPYIPDRIMMPSGRILDEIELLLGLDIEKVGSLERKELEGAFYFFNALTHPGRLKDMIGQDRLWMNKMKLNHLKNIQKNLFGETWL